MTELETVGWRGIVNEKAAGHALLAPRCLREVLMIALQSSSYVVGTWRARPVFSVVSRSSASMSSPSATKQAAHFTKLHYGIPFYFLRRLELSQLSRFERQGFHHAPIRSKDGEDAAKGSMQF